MKTSLKNILIAGSTFTLLAGSLQASVLIKWGEAGGDTEIITGGNADNSSIGRTYNGASITDPISYYESYNGSQNPIFSGASNNDGSLEVRDDAQGDYFGSPFDTGTGGGHSGPHSAMYTWDIPANDARLIFRFEARLRNGGDEAGEVRFLLEESSQFYISNPFAFTGNTYSNISISPYDLSWSLYTPFGTGGNAAGVDTIGASDNPSFTGITTVGFHTSSTDSTTGFTGVFTRYFQVEASAPEPSSLALLLIGFGLLANRRQRKLSATSI